MELTSMQPVQEETTMKIPKRKKASKEEFVKRIEEKIGLDSGTTENMNYITPEPDNDEETNMNYIEPPKEKENTIIDEEDKEALKKIKTEFDEDLATIDHMEDWKMIEHAEGLAKEKTKILGPNEK